MKTRITGLAGPLDWWIERPALKGPYNSTEGALAAFREDYGRDPDEIEDATYEVKQ